MCRWCERSPIADQLTAGLSLPARREVSADPDAAGGGGPGATPVPTIVFRNGMIRTMVVGRDRVESLAISGTTILAAGSAEEVKAQAGPKASVVDLQGRTLLPGLIDPHHHYTLSALLAQALLNIGYSAFHTKAQALQRLTATAATTPAGQWIAAGFFDNLLQGGDLSMPRSMRPSMPSKRSTARTR